MATGFLNTFFSNPNMSIKCTADVIISSTSCSACKQLCLYKETCLCHSHCGNCCKSLVKRKYFSQWQNLIDPYVNMSAGDAFTDAVLRDCQAKLNGVDVTNGLCVLHILLFAYDDDDLLRRFLELGVDADKPYVRSPSMTSTNPTIPEDLFGGTPIHFATYYGRVKCIRALLTVGVKLTSMTMNGQHAKDLAKTEEIANLLIEAEEMPEKTLVQMAKDGLWYAMRYRMRCGKVRPQDLRASVDGKTVCQWVSSHVRTNQVSFDGTLNPLKILGELIYRYERNSPSSNKPSTKAEAACDQEDHFSLQLSSCSPTAVEEVVIGVAEVAQANFKELKETIENLTTAVEKLESKLE